METKPYNLQSPEQIAKDYGGNKQKIAEAMQMGIIDPTAGTLAGMFIDRMRSAQMQEAAPQQTVAQQVFTPQAPQAPAAVPPMPVGGAPAGLGATPQAAQTPAPEEAPMGMAMGGMVPPYAAGGGLSELPLPDDMFGEPSSGEYAAGGIVAFAQGDMVGLYDDVEMQESGGRQSAVSPKGARGVMQLMPGTIRDPGFGVRPMQADTEAENRRVGREYLEAMFRRYGDKATALAAYNWGPGNVDKWLKSGADPKKLPSETRKYISNILGGKRAPEKQAASEDYYGIPTNDPREAIKLAEELTPQASEERAAYMQSIRDALSPEAQKKERSRELWGALAQFGTNLASTPGGLLQAAAQSAGAVLPGIMEMERNRREEARAARKDLAALENLSNEERRALTKMGVDLYGAGVEGLEKREAARLNRETQLDVAETYANAKGDAADAPVGETPKGKIALAKDLQKITDKVEKTYRPQLDMAKSANNPQQEKFLENRKLADIQQQEDELYAAYGMEPPARKPVSVPIDGKTYVFPNMYSALEAIRAYNTSNR